MGVGVGGRIGYHYATPISGRGATWWGFRVGGGLDLELLYARVATGIPDTTGKLCARVKADGAEVQYRATSMVLGQLPLHLGLELGLGTGADGTRGVVLGAAWTPTFSYIKPWVADGDLRASVLGAELSVDLTTVHESLPKQTGYRFAFFLLLPGQDRSPAVMTLSFGVFWY
jgi:hypothetical protein